MKVEFPQFINRSKLFFIFEMDMIVIWASVLLGVFWIFSKALPIYISLPIGIIASFKAVKLYSDAKYEKAPGFIRHFFYNLGMYKIDLDEEKYEELKDRDDKSFYPSGYIRDFRD
jgi:hypothetical protein